MCTLGRLNWIFKLLQCWGNLWETGWNTWTFLSWTKLNWQKQTETTQKLCSFSSFFLSFLRLTKSFKFCNVFQTSHGFNFNCSLPIHTKFDDLDFASESQMCQKQHFLRHLFHSCPILFKRCVAVSVTRCMEERARKKESLSHQDLVVSQFIHALQDKSTSKTQQQKQWNTS